MLPRIYNAHGELITHALSVELGWEQAQEIARSEGYASLFAEGINVTMEVEDADLE